MNGTASGLVSGMAIGLAIVLLVFVLIYLIYGVGIQPAPEDGGGIIIRIGR